MKTDTVLRVGLVHGGRVLDERVLRGGDVTVGTDPTCTFVLPGGVGAPPCHRVVAWAPRRAPRLLPAGLACRLAAGDTPVDAALIGASVTLTPSHRGKLVVGDSVILFQCLAAAEITPLAVRPPPTLRRGRLRSRLDWPLFQALIVSAVLLGGSGGGLAAWWHDTGRYFDDRLHTERQAEQLVIAEIAARIVREAPKRPEAAPDAPTAAAPTSVAEAVAVPAPAPPTPRPRATHPTKRVTKRAPTIASVRGSTILSVLGRPDAAGTVAGLTSTTRYADAFENTDGGVTVASRDAAAAAGGPDREASTARYVKVCEGEDCAGAPLTTRHVTTTQKGSGDDEAPIKFRPGRVVGTPTGTGRVDKAAIEAVFRRRKSAITYCYERYMKTHGATNGLVKLRFTLGTAGRITDIATVDNSFGDPAIGQCITDKVKTWRFPTPAGGTVTFVYPFILEVN